MKPIQIEINGEMMTGTVLKHGTVLWAHVNGRTFIYESEGTRAQKKKQAVENPGKIHAPMPGKIIKVLCQEGDKVVKDQTLVVMEAMKMEYALKVHAGGTVKKVNVSPGKQAALGDLLVDVTIDTEKK